jgi:hypothetical protein
MNIVLAILFAAGILLVVSAFFIPMEDLRALGRKSLFRFERVSRKKPSGPSKLQVQLEMLLYRAGAPITVAEFLTTSAIIGGVSGVVLLLTSRSIITAAIGALLGMALLYAYYAGKQDSRQLEYELVQPELLFQMEGYFKSRGAGDLRGALKFMAEKAPEFVRGDWEVINVCFSNLANIDVARLQDLVYMRGSASLARIVELFLQYNETPLQLFNLLPQIREELQTEIEAFRELQTAQNEPRLSLTVVTIVVFAMYFLYSLFIGLYRDFYASFAGQMVALFCFLYTVGVYLFSLQQMRGKVAPYMPQVSIRDRRTAEVFTATRAQREAEESVKRSMPGNGVL